MTEKTTISELEESAANLIKSQQYSEALPVLQSILNLDPNYELAWHLGADCLMELKKYPEAIDAYNKVISINPNSEVACTSKATALFYLGKYQEAIDAYNKVISINPNSEEAWTNKSTALNSLGKYQEAIDACNKVISINPNSEVAWTNKGGSLFELGRNQDALDACDKAISIDSNDPNAWTLKANVLCSLGKDQEALDAYNKGIAITTHFTATVGNGIGNTVNSQDHLIYAKPKKSFVPPISPKKGSDLKGFASVAGMNKLKEQLQKEVIAVLKNPEKYRKFDVGLPNGILLFGPPGCGKTFIVQKLAEELGYNFMEVPPSSVGSKFIHETSANIAKIFQDAKDKAPTLLFFDEFEALVPKRESLGSEGQFKNEEINEFLQHLNNAGKDNILVVGATNQPTLMDSGITRSGRFDRIIYVGPPDHDARKELFKIGLTKVAKSDDIDYEELAAKTDNYSSSDITLIVQDAKRLAADQELDEINQALLIYAVEKSKPSLTKSQIQNYIALAKDER